MVGVELPFLSFFSNRQGRLDEEARCLGPETGVAGGPESDGG